MVWGLYRLAQECCWLQKPAHQLQKPALRPNKDIVQISPPPEELLFVLMTRPILICQSEETPSIASLPSLEIPAPQQDQASAESELVTPWEPLISTTEQHSISETLIHQVEPVLGMTPMENWQLQNRNQPQDVMDILGIVAYEGYIVQLYCGLYKKLMMSQNHHK